MTDQSDKPSEYRMERSREALEDSRILADAGRWNACVNRLETCMGEKMVSYLKRVGCVVTWLIFFSLPFQAEAHNGAVAIAVPVEGITIDGDFSDWPPDMRHYPIARGKYGDRPKDESDFREFFRIAYNEAENALYLAVEMQDESTVIDTTAGARWDTQDGCEIFVESGQRGEDTPPAQYVLWGNTRRVFGARTGEDVKVEVQREAHGHRYEWRIAMSKEQVYLHPRTAVGFDVALWDKDTDGSASWVNWVSGGLGNGVLMEKGGATGKIQGRLRWEGRTEGIGHAEVRLQSLSAEGLWVQTATDQQGRFAEEVPAGSYRLEALRQERVVFDSRG